jgi:hypothetical protein
VDDFGPLKDELAVALQADPYLHVATRFPSRCFPRPMFAEARGKRLARGRRGVGLEHRRA